MTLAHIGIWKYGPIGIFIIKTRNMFKGVLGFWGFGEIGRASCRERV